MSTTATMIRIWLAILVGRSAVSAWSPVAAPLSTRWTQDVSPTQAAAYPRPQLRRPGSDSWQHLNGLWEIDYAVKDLSAPPFSKTLPHKILVPYPLESSLSGIRATAPHFSMFYRRMFRATQLLPTCSGTRILHFEKVDWNTTVWVDGVLLGNHVGGYDPFSFVFPDTTDTTDEGNREVIVGVYDATEMNPNHDQLFGKQQRAAFDAPSGMMYTSSSGIWDTVWLECVPAKDLYIADLAIVPDLDARAVKVTVDFGAPAAEPVTVSVAIQDGATIAEASSNGTDGTVTVTIPPAMPLKLWSPDSPYLYNLTVTTSRAQEKKNGLGDNVLAYFGFRKISIGDHPSAPSFKILEINGRPTYQIGLLDQGWFPDGLYAAATDEALQSDLLAMKQMNFNTVRKHMKVDTRRWYHHCDKLGLLVWQDIPQWTGDESEQPKLAAEIGRIMKAFRNSPALIQWNAFNEGWGEGSPEMANKTTQAMFLAEHGPAGHRRLINDASGGRGFGCSSGWVDPDKCPPDSRCSAVFWTGGCNSDVVDHHHYPDLQVPFDLAVRAKEQGQLFLQGEFGGYSLDVVGHQWGPCQGFQAKLQQTRTPLRAMAAAHATGLAATAAAEALPDAGLTQAYVRQATSASALLSRGLAGQIFTQISDIECERSGLFTYDRVPKAAFSAVAAANAALFRKVN